jgi:NAD(P)-dependent dehydrogenase (short-subunit alcohol dehydrogenase family)
MSHPIQTAVVTGASRGFGRAIAAALVAAGTGVVGIARYERRLRAVESERAGLGIRFVALLPQLTPAGGVGSAGVDGYAARQGVDRDTFIDGLQPVLTADQVAKAVTEIAGDPAAGPEYLVGGAGLRPVGCGPNPLECR